MSEEDFKPMHEEGAPEPAKPGEPVLEPAVELSADVAPRVEEFMAETAEANEAEGAAAAEESHFAAGGGLEAASFAAGEVTGPYISF